MDVEVNVGVDKEKFPDELIEDIIKTTNGFFAKVPPEAFTGWSMQQIVKYIETASSFMLLGADVAFNYMERKENNMDVEVNVGVDKEKFPDELIEDIIKATNGFFAKVPPEAFTGWSMQQIVKYIKTASSFMLLGADVAFNYMERKENNHESD